MESINFHVQVRQTQFAIPSELLRRNFRSVQRAVEKQKKQLAEDIAKIRQSSASPQAKLQMVRRAIAHAESLEQRLAHLLASDADYRARIASRNRHLQQLAQFGVEDDGSPTGAKLDLNSEALIRWYKDETNLLVVDYLIRAGASPNRGLQLLQELCRKSPHLARLIDADVFAEFSRVHASIATEHTLGAVTTWFNDNKQSLRKLSSNLEFEIRYCQLLSLIERNEVAEAIKYSQQNLSSYGNRDNYGADDGDHHAANLDKLKRIGGLLLYLSINESDSFSSHLVVNSHAYKEHAALLSHGRWEALAACFLDCFTRLYGVSRHYPLFVYLSAGLSSLKTKSCYCNRDNTIFATQSEATHLQGLPPTSKQLRGPNQYYRLLGKVNDCPVCSPELNQLSAHLPYAQLITRIFNNPFKLPNGNIYPFDKLLQINSVPQGDDFLLRAGKIRDPLTKEIFNVDDCIRVYPA
ncbi:RING-Gid-type domain-containing protein [[Candida] zeylanoides]